MNARSVLLVRAKHLCLQLHGWGDPADCPECKALAARTPTSWWRPHAIRPRRRLRR